MLFTIIAVEGHACSSLAALLGCLRGYICQGAKHPVLGVKLIKTIMIIPESSLEFLNLILLLVVVTVQHQVINNLHDYTTITIILLDQTQPSGLNDCYMDLYVNWTIDINTTMLMYYCVNKCTYIKNMVSCHSTAPVSLVCSAALTGTFHTYCGIHSESHPWHGALSHYSLVSSCQAINQTCT